MRRLLLTLPVVVLLTLGCAPAEEAPGRQTVETTIPAIDLASEGGVPWAKFGRYEGSHTLAERMGHYHVPGVSVAVIDRFNLVWTGAYGVTEAGGHEAVTGRTLFEAGSTTKVITMLATLRLAGQGALDLDENVNEYLSTWRVPESEFTVAEKVTPYRLLTHTGGVNRPDGGFGFEEGTAPTTVQVLAGEPPALNDPLRVELAPGSRHQYSNFGFVLLQQVLEDVSGEPFPSVIRRTVFEPAGMTASLFSPEAAGTEAAKPHTAAGEARESYAHPSALGQGGLRTTATDLAHLAVEIMKGCRGQSDRLIDETTAARVMTVQSEVDPAQNMGFTREGLGMFLLETDQGMAFCHPGYNEPGATSLFIGIPETGQALVVLTNGARGLELSMEILSSVSAAYSWPRIEPARSE